MFLGAQISSHVCNEANTHIVGHMQGSLVEDLQNLVVRASQPKATLLPAASKATTAFNQAVHSLVYDMLMQKVPLPECITAHSSAALIGANLAKTCKLC